MDKYANRGCGFQEETGRKQLLLLGIVLIGTLLAGGIFSQEIMLNLKGIVFGLLAATSYAIFLMTSGRVGNDLPVLKKSALRFNMISELNIPPASGVLSNNTK